MIPGIGSICAMLLLMKHSHRSIEDVMLLSISTFGKLGPLCTVFHVFPPMTFLFWVPLPACVLIDILQFM